MAAALVLGRCRRRVWSCDFGKPRNEASKAMLGYLTPDGFDSAKFRRIRRRELNRYSRVELRYAEVTDAQRGEGACDVTLAGSSRFRACILLLTRVRGGHSPGCEGLNARRGKPCVQRG